MPRIEPIVPLSSIGPEASLPLNTATPQQTLAPAPPLPDIATLTQPDHAFQDEPDYNNTALLQAMRSSYSLEVEQSERNAAEGASQGQEIEQSIQHQQDIQRQQQQASAAEVLTQAQQAQSAQTQESQRQDQQENAQHTEEQRQLQNRSHRQMREATAQAQQQATRDDVDASQLNEQVTRQQVSDSDTKRRQELGPDRSAAGWFDGDLAFELPRFFATGPQDELETASEPQAEAENSETPRQERESFPASRNNRGDSTAASQEAPDARRDMQPESAAKHAQNAEQQSQTPPFQSSRQQKAQTETQRGSSAEALGETTEGEPPHVDGSQLNEQVIRQQVSDSDTKRRQELGLDRSAAGWFDGDLAFELPRFFTTGPQDELETASEPQAEAENSEPPRQERDSFQASRNNRGDSTAASQEAPDARRDMQPESAAKHAQNAEQQSQTPPFQSSRQQKAQTETQRGSSGEALGETTESEPPQEAGAGEAPQSQPRASGARGNNSQARRDESADRLFGGLLGREMEGTDVPAASLEQNGAPEADPHAAPEGRTGPAPRSAADNARRTASDTRQGDNAGRPGPEAGTATPSRGGNVAQPSPPATPGRAAPSSTQPAATARTGVTSGDRDTGSKSETARSAKSTAGGDSVGTNARSGAGVPPRSLGDGRTVSPGTQDQRDPVEIPSLQNTPLTGQRNGARVAPKETNVRPSEGENAATDTTLEPSLQGTSDADTDAPGRGAAPRAKGNSPPQRNSDAKSTATLPQRGSDAKPAATPPPQGTGAKSTTTLPQPGSDAKPAATPPPQGTSAKSTTTLPQRGSGAKSATGGLAAGSVRSGGAGAPARGLGDGRTGGSGTQDQREPVEIPEPQNVLPRLSSSTKTSSAQARQTDAAQHPSARDAALNSVDAAADLPIKLVEPATGQVPVVLGAPVAESTDETSTDTPGSADSAPQGAGNGAGRSASQQVRSADPFAPVAAISRDDPRGRNANPEPHDQVEVEGQPEGMAMEQLVEEIRAAAGMLATLAQGELEQPATPTTIDAYIGTTAAQPMPEAEAKPDARANPPATWSRPTLARGAQVARGEPDAATEAKHTETLGAMEALFEPSEAGPHGRATTFAGRAVAAGEKLMETLPGASGPIPGERTHEAAHVQLTQQRTAMIMQALAQQPLMALVWADVMRLQQARLDQLAANRAVEDDGKVPPSDVEEATRQRRRIQALDLTGTAGHGPGNQLDWDDLCAVLSKQRDTDPWFRAAMLVTTLQAPQAAMGMFKSGDDMQEVRFYRSDKARTFKAQWHKLSADGTLPTSLEAGLRARLQHAAISGLGEARQTAQSWMEAAEKVYIRLQREAARRHLQPGPTSPVDKTVRALQTINGRDAYVIDLTHPSLSRQKVWRHLTRSNGPDYEPMVVTTRAACPDGFIPQHPYAVLGTLERGDAWRVALCNPMGVDTYAMECEVFAVSFDTFVRNMQFVGMLMKMPAGSR